MIYTLSLIFDNIVNDISIENDIPTIENIISHLNWKKARMQTIIITMMKKSLSSNFGMCSNNDDMDHMEIQPTISYYEQPPHWRL
jgi:hypothetical protein